MIPRHKKGNLNLAFLWIFLILLIGCGEGTGTMESGGTREADNNATSSAEIGKSLDTAHPSLQNPALSANSGLLSLKISGYGSVFPTGTNRLQMIFDEISFYKPDGRWLNVTPQSPPVVTFRTPPGPTASLIEAVGLPEGKYSRMRIGINAASIFFRLKITPVQIPNSSLKTTAPIEFTSGNGDRTDLIVVLNLGKSLLQLGETFKLYPQFYVVDERKAASMRGTIRAATSDSGGVHHGKVEVIVHRLEDNSGRPSSDQEIARLEVRRSKNPTPFDIRWLPSGMDYMVIARENEREIYQERVKADRFFNGSSHELNGGAPF